VLTVASIPAVTAAIGTTGELSSYRLRTAVVAFGIEPRKGRIRCVEVVLYHLWQPS